MLKWCKKTFLKPMMNVVIAGSFQPMDRIMAIDGSSAVFRCESMWVTSHVEKKKNC